MWFKKRNTRPTAEDTARRLIILKYVAVSALHAPPRPVMAQIIEQYDADKLKQFVRQAEAHRDDYWQSLRDAGLWTHMSPKEQTLSQSTLVTMTEQQQIDASFRIETIQALMWALGLIPEMPSYDTLASHEILEQVPSDNLPGFLKSAQLRNQTDIDEARDTAEFWNWRSRTRQLIERGDDFPKSDEMARAGFHSYDDIVRFSAGKAAEAGTIPQCIDGDFPAKGKAYRDLTAEEWSEVNSITMERHFALNWLCGRAPGNNWDETPTDT